MRKIRTVKSRAFLIIILCSFYLFYHPNSVSAVDLMDYMGTDYNYQGFTTENSYIGLNAHEYVYSTPTGRWEWIHHVTNPVCPTKYPNCKDINWNFPSQWRKRPDENIWVFSKNANIKGNQEIFWYNNDWVYVLSEAGWHCPRVNFSNNCFHNMGYTSGVEFPNRGQIWFKRNFNSGDSLYTPGLIINNYTDMQKIDAASNGLPSSWPSVTLTANYFPNWNSAVNTWDGLADNGNLPQSLDVVIIDSRSDGAQTREKYFYARKDNNKFGLIRFESWNTKDFSCGTVCNNAVADGDWILTTYNTFNLLTKFSDTPGFDNPEKFFQRYNYTDPKLEKILVDGRQERGKFRAPGNGQFANGTEFLAGDWITLSEIVTDSDYLISTVEQVNEQIRNCPDGYNNVGSFLGDACTHQGNCFQNRWVVLCGTTNKAVLAGDFCPSDFFQKGFFYSDRDAESKSIYDYQGNDISRGWVNFCVQKSEFSYSPPSTPVPTNIQPSSTPIPTNHPAASPTPNLCPKGDLGNLDCSTNSCIDTSDWELFRQAFGKSVSELPVIPPNHHTPDLFVDDLNQIDTADYQIFYNNFNSSENMKSCTR